MSDPASQQLHKYSLSNKTACPLRTSNGAPIGDKLNTATAGPRGPVLLQDFGFIDEMAHFDRERVPERVVHAKGGGAFGYFEVTHDITKYCKADLFSSVGKKTKVGVRFSTVAGENGSADTVRDPRGFAVKFYTDEGNWDLVGNNTPVFFIRDPIFFPSFIHTQKRNPVTHLKDANAHFDFATLRQETAHQLMILYSDRGIPDGFRHMNGYGSHTFKMVNAAGKSVWCKFHFKTDQGIKNLTADKAAVLASDNPDYSIGDLYNAIASGKYPSWSVKIQVMTPEQAKTHKFNPFDVTKVWPQKEFPLIDVGKMVLNRNPENYFSEVEQIAFCPSHMVPGIEPSPDKMLQGRLFSYADTHRHRIGTNYQDVPVNRPVCPVANYQRDGQLVYKETISTGPNYFPNSFNGPDHNKKFLESPILETGDGNKYNSGDDDNFTQAGNFYRNVLKADERTRVAQNIAGHLSKSMEMFHKRTIDMFSKVDPNLGKNIQIELEKRKKANL